MPRIGLKNAASFVLALSLSLTPTVEAQQYQYKVIQYGTEGLDKNIEGFTQANPGWEIVSVTPLALKGLGNEITIPTSILVLARTPVTSTSTVPPIAVTSVTPTTPPSTAPASRVTPLTAPIWALGGPYPGDFAKAISEKLAPPDKNDLIRRSAILDVVIDRDGSVLLVTARSGKVSAALVTAATAAVKAVSPFKPIPATAVIESIADQTFSFTVAP